MLIWGFSFGEDSNAIAIAISTGPPVRRVQRIRERWIRSGSMVTEPFGRRPALNQQQEHILLDYLNLLRPYSLLREMCSWSQTEFGVTLHRSSLSRTLRRLGWSQEGVIITGYSTCSYIFSFMICLTDGVSN